MTEQLQNSSGLPMNSRKYWDFRFEHTWETDGGREQTRYLYELLISALPDSIVQKLTTKPQSLLDWGCALGDGLARLVERFPLLVGTGCDHSLAAIEKARKSFPKLTFTDNAPRESAERYDIVLTSNTLGHFADPWKYAEELAASARDLLIIFVPFHDTQKEHETEYQFTATTIPPVIGGMRLLFAKVVESDPTYWSGSHLILIYQADALQDQKLLEGTLQNLEKYFSGKEVREAIVCYQAGKGKPDTSLLDYLVASCSGFFGFSHHEPMIPRSAVDELVETISRDRSRAMSAFLKGHLRNLQAGGNAYADFDTYAKRAMAFEQQFHALVNSVRFKVGRNICEFAKSVKQKDFRTARAIAGWSLRWAWRRTTGYEKRIARKSKLPTVSLHNNIARTQISEAVPAENLRYRKATIDCGAVSNLVSVVLPVYNHKKFLGDSIRSVLRQQYANLELIIVNDGSTEDLDSVLQEFASDPRVRYVRHRVNQRLPNALNTGFRFARGEFHTWTSADNLMEEHCLEGLVRFLRENPQHDMVFSGFQLIDHDGKTIPSWTGHEGGKVYWNQDTWLLNSTFNFVGAAFLYRHHAARAVGLYSTLFSGAEDYDYWMRLNNFFSIARHPDPNFAPYHYRFHHDSLTGNARAMRLEQFVARLKAIDRLRQGISVAPIDFILMSSEPELLKLQEDVIDCSIRSKPCKGPLPALIPDVKLVLRTAASQTQSSRSDLQHVNPFRDLATVQGLFLTGEEHIDNETLSKMIDAADFVILGSRDLLETVHHKRRFYINPLDRSAEFITALVRSIVSERLTDLHFDRTIPIDQGFEAKV